MNTQPSPLHLCAVVGAGPAGMFAARLLANQGVYVFLFNRDLKPGGLAEYGIYPTKIKAKEALRRQFRDILSLPGITYCGNVTIGEHGDLSINDLFKMGFQGVLVTAGAQGTKELKLPGENLGGVYHAKEIVYYYNLLPPFTEKEIHFGKNVAVIGVGNVMIDIARYLLEEVHVDQVTAFARRGPAEIKFDRKELAHLIHNLDFAEFKKEINRCAPLMQAVGQDPDQVLAFFNETLAETPASKTSGKMLFHFLVSPKAFLGENNRVQAIRFENNTLENKDGEIFCLGNGSFIEEPVDSVIYAIGDKVDGDLGLPIDGNAFNCTRSPRFPVDGISYEVEDPKTGKPIPAIFIAGWARKVSTGQVGVARKDGEGAAQALLAYLATQPELISNPIEAIQEKISHLPNPVVSQRNLKALQDVESLRACQLGLDDYKIPHNKEMLEIMGLLPDAGSHKV